MKLAILLLSIAISGCAAIATKGSLPQISTYPSFGNGKTLIYRATTVVPLLSGGARLQVFDYTEDLKPILEGTGIFSNVRITDSKIGSVVLKGKNTGGEQEELMRINFPVDADYFLDLQYMGKDYGPHGYAYWGFFHILSLGLIPIAINNDVHLKAILYDKSGKQLQVIQIDDTSTIWGWTPLYLFNGFKMINKFKQVSYPVRKNTLENAIAEMR